MKKLSLLVAFALIITIGGVYAAWSYAQGDVETAQGFVLPKMETVTTTGSKGQISVDTSGLTMKVDDTDDGNAHNTKLVMNDGGKIVITFTPAEGADSTVVTSGIKMQAVITCTENWEYNGTPMFTIDTTKNTFTTTGTALTWEITADQIAEAVSLSEIELDTYAEFLSYQTVLNQGNIKITVTEVE